MGMLIIGLAAFIIIGGIEVTIVGLMGLSLIGLFVALSMAVSKIVFHIWGDPTTGLRGQNSTR